MKTCFSKMAVNLKKCYIKMFTLDRLQMLLVFDKSVSCITAVLTARNSNQDVDTQQSYYY